MKISKLKKIIIGTGVLAGVAGMMSYKNIAHNIMSHHPTWHTNQEIIKELPKFLFTRGEYDGIPNNATCLPNGTDLNAIYLGKQKAPFQKSEYFPISALIPKDAILYDPSCMIDLKFNVKSLERTSINMLKKLKEIKQGEIISLKEEGNQFHEYYWDYGEGLINMQDCGPIEGFGNFTLSIGCDKKGKYLSFFDIFDFKTGNGGYFDSNDNNEAQTREKIAGKILSKIGDPIYFYKRWYFTDAGITDKLIEERLKNKINYNKIK